ncbi:hypothetical protein CDD81_8 [Ophiocordyceps australis]|uniref:Uncharacterized protein n=1 Tax=Ophiocordyceps australis TaxID=1399860 RepID=A0A2C5YIS7_9HYPO|nr:hypothetical protein CDD81_8 [Ophiocordyceps australis]
MERLGGGVLAAVEVTSLDNLLASLRPSGPLPTYFPPLDALCAKHRAATLSPTLSISGRPAPLIYALVSRLAGLNYALLVVDFEGWFDASRLVCADEHLHHVYVMQDEDPCADLFNINSTHHGQQQDFYTRQIPPAPKIRAAAHQCMLRAAAASRHRQWWGEIVIGAEPAAGHVVVPPGRSRGWLRVERRGEAWLAHSEWGSFLF